MHRRPLVIALVVLVIAVGVFMVLRWSGPEPMKPASVARTETAAPRRSTEVAKPVAPAPAAPAARRPREAAPPPAPPPSPLAAVATASDAGTLHIVSDVPGAQVFLDRQFIGAAPVTASSIKPGSHQLNVSAEGYDGFAETIDVESGPRDITVRFKQVRIDARIDVIHKHRMGSCKGRLVASPQSLRYETTDKDDAFSVGLLDLDTFQVDYLEKNLKVKPRKGRQFNFTDPDGNADRLFVFHRDVEKARERLKKGDPPAGD